MTDSPIGPIDPNNPPSTEEARLLAEWQGQQVAQDLVDLVESFLAERVKPYADFVASTGAPTADIWRAISQLLRNIADALDNAATST